jgi:LytS/YehU family sensor histidine kinase
MDVEPETLDALVPNLLLQPLVENAIRHGIAPRSEAGHVGIHARRQGPRLEISVVDDGPGLHVNGAGSVGQGIGLANTRARLQQLFGADQDFALSNGAAAGLTVSLSLPFREGPDGKEEDRLGPCSPATTDGVAS